MECCGNDTEAYCSSLIFSLKWTPRMSANTEKELHSLTQILQVRKHPDWNMDQRQCCQTGWVRFKSVVEGKHFKQPDGLDGGLHTLYCTVSHMNKLCVRNRKYVKFLAYIPVFILNSTSFWSAGTGYTFLQKRIMDILERRKNFSDDRKTQWPSLGWDIESLA